MNKELELSIKRFMAEKLAEQISLSDIQKMIAEKFGEKLTYMDVRILASTLDGIDWNATDPVAQEKAKEKAKAEEAKKADEAKKVAAEEAGPDSDLSPDDAEPAAPADGKTVVELSKLARPGMALSGTVQFASGSTADWYVDNMGRLGLENLVGAKPTREDVEGFQMELERIIRGGTR